MSEFHLPDETIELPLKEGEVYKNYKEMCKALGEEERTGRARQNQLKHWQMYFDYEREGYKYIIQKIIESKYRRWHTNRSKSQIKPYSTHIQKLLLSLIYDYSKENKFLTNVNDVILSNKLIAEMLAMVNKSYYHYYSKTETLSQELNINIELAQDFYMRYTSMITSDIRTAFKQLESQNLIHVEEVTVYREYITPELTGYEKATIPKDLHADILKVKQNRWERLVDENNSSLEYMYGDYIVAPSEIVKQILQTKYATMESLGAKDTRAIMAMGAYAQYQSRVIKHLRSFFGIAYYFKAYKVVFSPELLKYVVLKKGKNIKLNPKEESALKTTLNTLLQENIKDNYNRHRKDLTDFLEKGDYFGEYYPMLPRTQKLLHDNNDEDIDILLQTLVSLQEK